MNFGCRKEEMAKKYKKKPAQKNVSFFKKGSIVFMAAVLFCDIFQNAEGFKVASDGNFVESSFIGPEQQPVSDGKEVIN